MHSNTIPFASEEHRRFYYSAMKKVPYPDEYHKALLYVLGVSEDTRRNIDRLFDFEKDIIHPESLDEGWQTGGTRRLTRMAFNLWNGYTETGQEAMSTPYQMFDCGFAPYMMQGIRLRYPEYCQQSIKAPQLQ